MKRGKVKKKTISFEAIDKSLSKKDQHFLAFIWLIVFLLAFISWKAVVILFIISLPARIVIKEEEKKNEN